MRQLCPPRHRQLRTRPRRSRSRPTPSPSRRRRPLAAPAQPADMNERLAQLKQLGELMSAGVLTQAEFEQQKPAS